MMKGRIGKGEEGWRNMERKDDIRGRGKGK